MKKFSTLNFSALVAVAAALCVPASSFAQSILQTSGNFVVLGVSAVTSTTPSSTVSNGFVGSSTVNGFPANLAITPAGFSPPVGAGGPLTTANGDFGNAYTKLRLLVTPPANVLSADMAGMTLAPGIYGTSAGVPAAVDGTWNLPGGGGVSILTLDAQGKDNVFWVINIGGSLTTPARAQVRLINPGPNGGRDDGVFWTAGAAFTFGALNQILGNYMTGTFLTFGNLGTVGTVGGAAGSARVFAGTNVTLDSDIIDAYGAPGATDLTGGLKFVGGLVVPTATAPTIVTPPALTQSATVGGTVLFTVSATGLPATFTYTWKKGAATLANGGIISGATTNTLTLTGVALSDAGSYTVTVSNGVSPDASTTLTPAVLTVSAAGAPVINAPFVAAGTINTAFTYTITATNSPTSYAVTSPLPAGLALVGATISGTPTASGLTHVGLSATNGIGTGIATLDITIAPAAGSPIIAILPLTAAGTVGTSFSFPIIATGSPTSYAASPLPAGLSLVGSNITGTPTTAGTTIVGLSATNAFGTGLGTVTITVAGGGGILPVPVIPAPVITNNPLTAAGTIGIPFNFAITATGSPTAHTTDNSKLPPGLTLNASKGTINGTPTTAGIFVVPLIAVNSGGAGFATLTITIAAASVAPIISSPATAPGTVGTPFATYLIVATGVPTSYAATGLPAGLTVNSLTGAINGTPTTAGTSVVTLTATNAAGVGSATLTIVVASTAVAPIITSPTTAQGTVATPFVTYIIAGTGLPTSYSATGLPAGLTLDPLTGAINGTATTAGTYVVTIKATNTTGTSTATLIITIAPVPSSRIVNFSARAVSGPASQSLIMGFVVSGDNKNLLVRGVGPTLASYGLSNPLADPFLTMYGANGIVFASNDDWQTGNDSALIASTAAQVGAFALPNGSKDSALLFTANNGAHTTGLLRPNSTTGVAMIELYDTDVALGSRLINVSARMNVTTGDGTLIAGFVIKGNAPKTVLIRGIGPTLSVFGVTAVLADPAITVLSGSTQIAGNDNWETGTSTAAQMSSAFAQVGAFALAAGSKDAALLVTLQPGNYTVQVTGVGGTSGVALVEIYDMQ